LVLSVLREISIGDSFFEFGSDLDTSDLSQYSEFILEFCETIAGEED
jgi:hypothetical protein